MDSELDDECEPTRFELQPEEISVPSKDEIAIVAPDKPNLEVLIKRYIPTMSIPPITEWRELSEDSDDAMLENDAEMTVVHLDSLTSDTEGDNEWNLTGRYPG